MEIVAFSFILKFVEPLIDETEQQSLKRAKFGLQVPLMGKDVREARWNENVSPVRGAWGRPCF